MGNHAYLLEATRNGKTQHHLCCTETNALERASWHIQTWIWGGLYRCNLPPFGLKEQVEALLRKDRYADAIRIWNNHFCDPCAHIHEVEIVSEDCHHQPLETSDDDHFVVAIYDDEGCADYTLCGCHDDALGFVGRMLALDGYGYKSDVMTRKKVRQLLDEEKIAEAMDAWNQGQTEPKFAVQQIRVVGKNCHRKQTAQRE
jgi:hypothetical protein